MSSLSAFASSFSCSSSISPSSSCHVPQPARFLSKIISYLLTSIELLQWQLQLQLESGQRRAEGGVAPLELLLRAAKCGNIEDAPRMGILLLIRGSLFASAAEAAAFPLCLLTWTKLCPKVFFSVCLSLFLIPAATWFQGATSWG